MSRRMETPQTLWATCYDVLPHSQLKKNKKKKSFFGLFWQGDSSFHGLLPADVHETHAECRSSSHEHTKSPSMLNHTKFHTKTGQTHAHLTFVI